VGASQSDIFDAAGLEGILFNWSVEWRLYGLPRHARPVAFCPGNTWDSQVAEFGIACEACHSEGAEHIALNRNPIRRFKIHLTTKSDPTMTNPSRLKGPDSGLACGQCHSVWAFNNMTDKIDFNRHGASFRPGQHDLEQRFVVQPSTSDHTDQKDFIRRTEPDFFGNRFWGDGMIRVTGREFNGVQASPCFRGGEFSCISCHEMHLDALINIAAGLTARKVDRFELRPSVSFALIWAAILLPAGFFLGGIVIYDGDPGLGVWLVPVGAILLFYSVIRIALDLSKLK
jgi:hypothetical protein